MRLILALAFSVLGSIGAVAGAAGVLLVGQRVRVLVDLLVSYAIGTLLGASLIAMLPAALDRGSTEVVLGAVLGGLVAFFVLERLMLWRHRHNGRHEHIDASAELILVGDAVHNLIDGFAIGAAFAEGGTLGISTALAVIAHEIAQEIGDFAILLDSGLSRRRALTYNIVSSLTTIPAAAVAFAAASFAEEVIPFVLAIGASSFLYIALADLVPRHHRRRSPADLPWEVALIGLGVGTIVAVHLVE
jgi:zinc and cadmium transporter